MNSDERIEKFYASRTWRNCRKAYLQSKGGLCEICYRKGLIEPATEVHHKEHLTSENIDDANVTLSFDNLLALCERCHQEQHHTKRWRCLPDGRIIL